LQTSGSSTSGRAAAAVSQASTLQRLWRALQTGISACLAATLLLLQGGWQHPWHATKTAAHWLNDVFWSAAVMCMWLCIGYATHPFVLGALFGVYRFKPLQANTEAAHCTMSHGRIQPHV
jgi:hypothetical protein